MTKHFFIVSALCYVVAGLYGSEAPRTQKPLTESKVDDLSFIDKTTGATKLHKAAGLGDECEVSRLVNLGIDVNKPDNKEFTPLYYAAVMGNASMVEFLVRKCGAHLTDKKDDPLVHLMRRQIEKAWNQGVNTDAEKKYYNALIRIKNFLIRETERNEIKKSITRNMNTLTYYIDQTLDVVGPDIVKSIIVVIHDFIFKHKNAVVKQWRDNAQILKLFRLLYPSIQKMIQPYNGQPDIIAELNILIWKHIEEMFDQSQYDDLVETLHQSLRNFFIPQNDAQVDEVIQNDEEVKIVTLGVTIETSLPKPVLIQSVKPASEYKS